MFKKQWKSGWHHIFLEDYTLDSKHLTIWKHWKRKKPSHLCLAIQRLANLKDWTLFSRELLFQSQCGITHNLESYNKLNIAMRKIKMDVSHARTKKTIFLPYFYYEYPEQKLVLFQYQQMLLTEEQSFQPQSTRY